GVAHGTLTKVNSTGTQRDLWGTTNFGPDPNNVVNRIFQSGTLRYTNTGSGGTEVIPVRFSDGFTTTATQNILIGAFLQPPVAQTITVGATVTETLAGPTGAGLTYQWYQGTNPAVAI